jgi:hypothetical protein
VLVAVLATSCGADLIGSASTSTVAGSVPSTTTTTTTAGGEMAVAFPVVACTTPGGGPLDGQSWKPSVLMAPLPTVLVGKVEFYSDGTHSILGPNGWSCIQTSASDGARGLAVYPTGGDKPPANGSPVAGTVGVFAAFDTTGHSAGAALVCPFFTIPSWQQREAGCSGQKPSGEGASMPTADIASVTDPPGVVGTLAGSGGAQAVTGAVIFPQALPAVTYGSSIDIAVESCALTDTSLCPAVVSDFEVREFPIPSGNGSSG